MIRKFDLVISDADGTLIDNRIAIRTNFNRALQSYGFQQLSKEEIDSMIGIPLLEMFQRALPVSRRDLATSLVKEYRTHYEESSHLGVVILDGVIETLEKLQKDKFKLAVATTKVDYVIHPLLKKIGLYEYFDLVTGVKEGMRSKPHGDMIDYIMEKLNIPSHRTTLIGDTSLDVLTARSSKIYSIVVTSGVSLGMTTMNEIYAAKPDTIIESFRDLPRHLYI